MIDLFAIYICPKHGEVLEDETSHFEDVDTEADSVIEGRLHDDCWLEVTPKLDNGVQCFASVDHERWLWANGFYDDLDHD